MQIDVRLTSPLLTARSDAFARAVRFLGEACVMVNREFLSQFPDTTPLYGSSVRYQNEPMNAPDKLLDIPSVMRQGWGDCLHLSCWRIAELRELGEDASFRIVWKPIVVKGQTKRLFHVLVRRKNGQLEDPSVILGM